MTDQPQSIPPAPPLVIALVGFMGAGKTTVGRALAAKLRCRFVDLDDLIITAERMTVTVIFAKKGEAYFRQAESRELERLLADFHGPLVLSLGGGAFVQETNRAALRRAGAVVVQLAAPVEELRQRVGQAHERPLARDPQKFKALYEERQAAYAKADFTVNTSGQSVEAVALRLFERITSKTLAVECSPNPSDKGGSL